MNEHGLNPAQKEAVKTLAGPLLIIAGAGAGKTKTITHRILNLIKSGVRPSEILAITFTNKAAKEMRERVFRLIEEDKTLNIPISFSERPFVCTFHALGVHIIKENSQILGIPRHFTIYDRGDSKKAVKDALTELGYDVKEYDPGTILNAISREKGDGITLNTYKNSKKEYFQQIVEKVWEKYEKTLNMEKSLDFDDLLLKTVVLLRQNEDIREKYSNIWKYIHIDEYQDTNKVQYEIASLLSEKNRNICVVGDIDQNIYSWRGSDITNILNFEKEYPEAKVITLEENYRSTQTILTAANNVIKKNVMRREKNLFTKNSEGEKIELLISYTEQEEARVIVDEIRNLLKNGSEPRDFAVLYRANFQSRVLEEAFLHKNIPYQVLGIKFFERKEVKDVISFIKASLNRESTNDLVRIVNVPPRGIGKTTILKVVSGEENTLGPAIRNKVAIFLNLLERIKNTAMKESPSNLIKYIIKETGMEITYRNGGPEEQEKLENLRELVTVASQYDAIFSEQGAEIAIEKLLENVALATDQDEMEKDNNAVKLMTVHASKGLEFDYVFISGLEEDLFPHARMGEGRNGKQATQSEMEEERRLFYVAITRARKKVFLSYAQIRTIFGAQKINTPSHFISDIGDEHIESKGDVEEPRGIKAIFIDF